MGVPRRACNAGRRRAGSGARLSSPPAPMGPPPDTLTLRGQALAATNDDLLHCREGEGGRAARRAPRIPSSRPAPRLSRPPPSIPLSVIDSLRKRRDAAAAEARAADADRAALAAEAASLSKRAAEAADRLAAATATRVECEGVLGQAEGAYAKILDSLTGLAAALRAEADGGGGGDGG